VAERRAAQVLATLRNLALGLYELALARGLPSVTGVKSSARQMTFTRALAWLRR
jgi:hypothetical protein